MKLSFKIIAFFSVLLTLTACNNKKTLQSYLVETQDKPEFVTVDLPTSFLKLQSDKVSDDIRETLESIKKVNIVALPIKGNESKYETEKATLKNIFKNNDSYKSLIDMKVNGMNVKLYYSGKTTSINEIIVFGYSKEIGVGVARLLGDNIDTSKIITLMRHVQVDKEKIDLEQLSSIFKSK
jgi:hypothetical protein